MDTERAARRWAETWAAAWPRHDAEAIAALYARGAQYRALAFRDSDSALDYLRRTFAEETDVSCRFGEPIVAGNRAAVEWWASWIEEAKPITLAGTTVLRFDEDGKVVDQRDYWNDADGRLEPYSGW